MERWQWRARRARTGTEDGHVTTAADPGGTERFDVAYECDDAAEPDVAG